VPDPQRDARRLLGLGIGRQGGDTSDPVTLAPTPSTRRAARVPVSRITGRRAFWKHEFESDAVLDPRPDTETLVEIALVGAFRPVLDLGTGSGCILLSLWRSGPGHAGPAPTSPTRAGGRAPQRRAAGGGAGGVPALGLVRGVEGRFDLIVSNPPYIAPPICRPLRPRSATTPPSH
jgi:release factor glutamine methyltransferase